MATNALTGESFNLVTLIMSSIGILVAVIAIGYSRAALFPGKRELRVQWVTPAPLIAGPSSQRVSLLVELDNKVLISPFLTHVEFHVSGRHDIRSSDFDRGAPFALDFGTTTTLTATAQLDPFVRILAHEDRILIEPSLLKRGTRLSFSVITEGAPPKITPTDQLADTKVTTSERQSNEVVWKKEHRRLLLASVALAIATLTVSIVSMRTSASFSESTEQWSELVNTLRDACFPEP